MVSPRDTSWSSPHWYASSSLCVCVCVCRVAVVVSSANMELELVRQCVDRALVLDDRVSKFSVQLGERPGDMARLLDVLSREDVRDEHESVAAARRGTT